MLRMEVRIGFRFLFMQTGSRAKQDFLMGWGKWLGVWLPLGIEFLKP